MLVKPAKHLALLLQNKIIVERANAEYIQKYDGIKYQLFLVSNEKEIFKAGYGPAINDENFTLTKDEAFNVLANNIKSKGDRFKFHLLPIPITTAVDHVTVDINNNVIIRCIDYYDVMSDEILTRYDILIEKVNSNV